MNLRSKLIYKIEKLNKDYGNRTVLKIGRLQFHPGTIYGIVGPIGSGKTTLLKILAAMEKPTSGVIEYDSEPFKTNWFGKLKKYPDIHFASADLLPKHLTIGQIAKKTYPKKFTNLKTKYFPSDTKEKLWNTPISSLSPGEIAWVSCILALEGDPRVLIIDDYGILLDHKIEFEFRKRIQKMNKDLGTTIILATPTDQIIKSIVSVIIYMDNGHVAKIRSTSSRTHKKPTKKKYTKKSKPSNNMRRTKAR